MWRYVAPYELAISAPPDEPFSTTIHLYVYAHRALYGRDAGF
jgi:hypothetical protein